MPKKYELAAFLTIEEAEILFRNDIALIVTDGRYLELENEQ